MNQFFQAPLGVSEAPRAPASTLLHIKSLEICFLDSDGGNMRGTHVMPQTRHGLYDQLEWTRIGHVKLCSFLLSSLLISVRTLAFTGFISSVHTLVKFGNILRICCNSSKRTVWVLLCPVMRKVNYKSAFQGTFTCCLNLERGRLDTLHPLNVSQNALKLKDLILNPHWKTKTLNHWHVIVLSL